MALSQPELKIYKQEEADDGSVLLVELQEMDKDKAYLVLTEAGTDGSDIVVEVQPRILFDQEAGRAPTTLGPDTCTMIARSLEELEVPNPHGEFILDDAKDGYSGLQKKCPDREHLPYEHLPYVPHWTVNPWAFGIIASYKPQVITLDKLVDIFTRECTGEPDLLKFLIPPGLRPTAVGDTAMAFSVVQLEGQEYITFTREQREQLNQHVDYMKFRALALSGKLNVCCHLLRNVLMEVAVRSKNEGKRLRALMEMKEEEAGEAIRVRYHHTLAFRSNSKPLEEKFEELTNARVEFLRSLGRRAPIGINEAAVIKLEKKLLKMEGEALELTEDIEKLVAWEKREWEKICPKKAMH